MQYILKNGTCYSTERCMSQNGATLDVVSQTLQDATDPWNSWPFFPSRTYPVSQIQRNCAWQKTGSCLDPELLRTCLRKGADTGPGPPCFGEKSQLEPSRDGGDMARDKEKHIRDVMQEDQRPTKWEDCLFTAYQYNKWHVDPYRSVTVVFSFRRINNLVLHHLHWSSVNMQAESHVSNRNSTNPSMGE
jgi:hypothetical protein